MDEFLFFYGVAITAIGVFVTIYAIGLFFKERETTGLKRAVRCFAFAALSFTITGVCFGISYTNESEEIVLRFAPQVFYLLGLVFLLLGVINLRKFSGEHRV